MPKDALPDCDKDSRFNSDASYRGRLAQQVQAALAAESADAQKTSELRRLLKSSLYGVDDATERDELARNAESLSEKLRYHPDLQSRLALLTNYSTSKWLLEQELICRRAMQPGEDAYEKARQVQAIGVCFSGGGIRSATFNLGVLQGLAQRGKLPEIDYISTVSGGGYIHQFLAAWIKNESADKTDALRAVQQKLIPIPDRGTGRIHPPEPIRWLRRYSNYLSPSLSLFGADVWVMAEVWLRNTALNCIIVTCTILFALLLPHVALLDRVQGLHAPAGFIEKCAFFAGLMMVGLGAAALLGYSFPRYCAKAELEGARPGNDSCAKDRTRPWHAYAITLAWLVVSIFVSGVVYRLSVPGGSPYSATARRDYAALPADGKAASLQFKDEGSGSHADLSLSFKGDVPVANASDGTPPSRIGQAWSDRPLISLPAWASLFAPTRVQAPVVYAARGLAPDNQDSDALRSPQDRQFPARLHPVGVAEASPLLWLYEAGLPLLYLFFYGAIWRSRKETTGPLASALSFLCSLPAAVFALFLVFVFQQFFFALSFAVAPEHVMALGATVIPSFLLAIPFIALEVYCGLMGTLYASAQREWIARLRAVSFQVGILWLALWGISLLGPHLVQWIGQTVVLKYTVWSTWLVSTVVGLLLGKSRGTTGKPKDASDPGQGLSFQVKEAIVKIVPPFFILGLLLLLSDLAGWLLAGSQVGQPHEPFRYWVGLLAAVGVTGGLLAWRVDINEFSMNSFYRDRLARCYAGASNKERRPNLFSGFDYRDNKWRVTGLLPKTWKGLDGSPGEYDGPFPIFCTALNLTTGRELAYQERKAASFGITPLYSGYATGWTDATDARLQYNGFVPTACHVRRASNGITMSSAVAISGAAASPNMGFHSSPPMAFLMTIFNVRLGWWLRNPRRRNTSDSPNFGLFYLLNELRGSTDDTSRFVYLSDGGHFENMGLYELIRRRCRTIIICDAEADSSLCFEGIGMAIRKARIDFGVEINLTGVLPEPKKTPDPAGTAATTPIAPREPESGTPTGAEGLLRFKPFPGNPFHALTGDILYPEDAPGAPAGKLLYIKSTLTGDEPPDVLNYHRVHPSFPFDTTLNQFFTESQFESYRRLGEHIVLKDEVQGWIDQNIKRSWKAAPEASAP